MVGGGGRKNLEWPQFCRIFTFFSPHLLTQVYLCFLKISSSNICRVGCTFNLARFAISHLFFAPIGALHDISSINNILTATFQSGQRMGLRQGIGLLALLALHTTNGEDYDYSSRSEQPSCYSKLHFSSS